MTKQQDYSILGIGNPFYDRFAFVDEAFLLEQGLIKGETYIVDNRQTIDQTWDLVPKKENLHHGKLGGSCPNVIKVLSKLGHQCALCGKVGSDNLGQILIDKLNHTGVIPLITKGRKGTGVVNCFITPDCQRTMQAYLGSAYEFSENNVEHQYFNKIAHIHLESFIVFFGNALEKSIQLARNAKATISLDLSSANVIKEYKQLITQCASQVDFLFGNLSEILALTNTSSPEVALKLFGKNQTIVVTLGAEGCWVKASGQSDAVHFNAQHVDNVIDTTGAGDYFDGGFLHAIFSGKSIPECVDMGNLTASYVIQQLGAELPDDSKEFSKRYRCEQPTHSPKIKAK